MYMHTIVYWPNPTIGYVKIRANITNNLLSQKVPYQVVKLSVNRKYSSKSDTILWTLHCVHTCNKGYIGFNFLHTVQRACERGHTNMQPYTQTSLVSHSLVSTGKSQIVQ